MMMMTMTWQVSLAVSGGDEHTARAYLKEAARCCKATPSADLLPLEGEVVEEAGQWVDKYRPKRPSLVSQSTGYREACGAGAMDGGE